METETKKKNGTFRWWFLTYNNPSEGSWKETLKSFNADYSIGQLEQGENGTIHIQGCLYYTKAIRATQFKGQACWLKGISSSEAQRVIAYCRKNQTRLEGPVEMGDVPKSISETKDWDTAKQLAMQGRVMEIQSSILIPYFTNLQKINAISTTPFEATDVRGIWVWGPPGAGKSHYARSLPGSIYIKPQNKWFDGYLGQEIILLDDFDESGTCLGHYLKIWADKWACYGEIKGATVALKHKQFVITSNYLPRELWKDAMLEAIERRFNFVDMTQYKMGLRQDDYISALINNSVIDFE